jgi:hypothetical protein
VWAIPSSICCSFREPPTPNVFREEYHEDYQTPVTSQLTLTTPPGQKQNAARWT